MLVKMLEKLINETKELLEEYKINPDESLKNDILGREWVIEKIFSENTKSIIHIFNNLRNFNPNLELYHAYINNLENYQEFQKYKRIREDYF